MVPCPLRRRRLLAALAALLWLGPAPAALAGPVCDCGDGDGIPDVLDNCINVPNAPPLDCDTDQDGYGNACDGDFNQDGFVNATDFSTFFLADYTSGTDSGIGTDMNRDGFVNATDFSAYFLPQFTLGAPGPSGLACAGTPACH